MALHLNKTQSGFCVQASSPTVFKRKHLEKCYVTACKDVGWIVTATSSTIFDVGLSTVERMTSAHLLFDMVMAITESSTDTDGVIT